MGRFSTFLIFLAALSLYTTIAPAADTSCNGSFTGAFDGNIVVPPGGACTLYQARVTGDVHVLQNANLNIDGREEWSSIGGNIEAAGCASVFLDGAVAVGRNLLIHDCQKPSGFTGPGIKIHGNFLCQNNPGGCKAVLGEIGGNAQVINNHSKTPSDISLNAIIGNLQCEQNGPPPTHTLGGDWVAGQLHGQCGVSSGFAAEPIDCGALAGLSLPDTTITLARTYGAGEFITVGPVNGQPFNIFAPVALCRVVGKIQPSTNPSGDSNINFEVWLPLENWTGRYEQVGHGGSAGTIRYLFDIASLEVAVANHNATAATDDGTHAPVLDGSFAVGHPQKINDYGYRAVHRTALNAQLIVTAFYGTPASKNYFKGCSKGGGEGLTEAQRYPEDFDGIMAGAPANNFVSFAAAQLWDVLQVANPNNPAGFVPSGSLPDVTTAVQLACASTKTVPTDNFLGDPLECHFDPGIFSSFLTAPQVNALEAVYNGPVTSSGQSVAPGFEPGNEAQLWSGVITEANLTAIPSTAHFRSNASGVQIFTYFTQQTSLINTLFDFDVDTSPGVLAGFPIVPASPGSAVQTVGAALDATNPDLAAFKAHGGKLIQYHGWADMNIQPRNSVEYFEKVVTLAKQAHGDHQRALSDTQDYYRLFMVPGMGHCRAGPGPNEFGRNGGSGPASIDLFTALEAWVEQDTAPDRVTAWHCPSQTFTTSCTLEQGTFTRPLCPYPQKATYTGTGSTNDAANFICE